VTWLPVVFLLLVSCGINTNNLRDLDAVQHALTAALGTHNIQITLTNGRVLNVNVVSPPSTTKAAPQNRSNALEIARLAYRSYSSRRMLSAVTVTFTIRQTYLGILNFDNSRSFVFPVSQLDASGLAPTM
jgi:hypothetical protein